MSSEEFLSEGEKVCVRPTYATNPHDFYVRRVKYDAWVLNFQQLAETNLPPSFTSDTPPAVGTLVLLKHAMHGWARGQVHGVRDDGKRKVYTCDYGEVVDGIDATALRPLLWGFERPPMAIHCRLQLCEPLDGIAWTAASIASFLKNLGAGPMSMTVMNHAPGGKTLIVEIENGLPERLSWYMVMAGAATYAVQQQVNPLHPVIPGGTRRNYNYLYDSLAPGAEVDVRVLVFQGHTFQVVREERYCALQKMGHLLEGEFNRCKHFRSASAGKPVVCRLKREDNFVYLRGLILRTKLDATGGELADVYLVDYGEQETIAVCETVLRRSKSFLLEQPAFAVPCCPTTKPPLGKGLYYALLRPGVRLTLTIVTVGKDYREPHVVNIVKEIPTI